MDLPTLSPIEQLEALLRRLPGIGEKSARRLAISIVKASEEYCRDLALGILKVREKVRECARCRNLGEGELCPVCADPRRGRETLCVVATVQDLQAIERSRAYTGTYFVLHGCLAPLDGVGPDELSLDRLVALVREEGTAEVIIATNPSSEGDATASYIARHLAPLGVHVTRIASGIPHGGEIEYIDPLSIKSSLSGRRDY